MSASARDQLAARLRDAGDSLAVVCTTTDPDAAQRLLADAGRPLASVSDLSPTSAETPSSRRDPALSTSAARGVDDSTGSRRTDPSDSTEVNA
jgi:RND superfamily putative drug exporter